MTFWKTNNPLMKLHFFVGQFRGQLWEGLSRQAFLLGDKDIINVWLNPALNRWHTHSGHMVFLHTQVPIFSFPPCVWINVHLHIKPKFKKHHWLAQTVLVVVLVHTWSVLLFSYAQAQLFSGELYQCTHTHTHMLESESRGPDDRQGRIAIHDA